MKGKSVFYLCLFIAFIFFALGFSSGYWFFIHWIQLGAFLMKWIFWIIIFGIGGLTLWFMFHKKDKKDEDGKGENNQ